MFGSFSVRSQRVWLFALMALTLIAVFGMNDGMWQSSVLAGQEEPFTGTWEGTDPDDQSIITLTLTQSGSSLEGTFRDTYSEDEYGRKISPGYAGPGVGTVLSATEAQMYFNLTRSDGSKLQLTALLQLSNQNTLLLWGYTFTGEPAFLQRVGPQDAQLTFEQIDFQANGVELVDSSWGSATLAFTSTSDILYLNLNVNGEWVIQNVPVISPEGLGPTPTMTFDFDLGVSPGTDVSELDFAYELTDNVLWRMPSGLQKGEVKKREVVIDPGVIGYRVSIIDYLMRKVSKLIGALADGYAFHTIEFPNQQAGKLECAPTAVSNSLKFLNKKHNLGLSDQDINVGAMKGATDWTRGGVYPDHWENHKAEFMRRHCYSIDTKVWVNTPPDFDTVIAAIKAGKDVEIGSTAHVVSVVGITKLKNGKYALAIKHDTNQKDDSKGTETQSVIYNPKPSPGTFEGGKWMDGLSFKNLLIESAVPQCTPNAELDECARRLALNTGREHKTEHPSPLQIPENEYIDFMKYDLEIYVTSTQASVTQEMKCCARKLLAFLGCASEEDKKRMAEKYVNSYWEGYNA